VVSREATQDPGGLIYSAVDIQKKYHSKRVSISVLNGINLDIRRGEILSIVGMSGVGKSTLLNILGLLDAPTSGRLMYHGRDKAISGLDLTTLSLQRKAHVRNREFGFVFQFYHLLPDLSVLENVVLPSMILYTSKEFKARRSEINSRAEMLLEQVGIANRKNFPPTQLSGGERQRAAIARALMNQPQVVFFDEPTGNLDTRTGQKIHSMLMELNATTDVAFIFVTHDDSLANLADRKIFMRDGVFEHEEALHRSDADTRKAGKAAAIKRHEQ